MTFQLDRRSLLKGGTLGLGALAVPGAAQISAARGFTHGVASGEPGQETMLLWTRYVPSGGGEARIEAELSRDAGFSRPIAAGAAIAGPGRDHTVKILATGLEPGRAYHYRFRAPDGSRSPVGRTRTLPSNRASRFTLGVMSCANMGFGWFNAYAHAAARDDIDLIVHLGDYLYEYQRGRYPTAAEAVPGRIVDPPGEAVLLADYRLRHAAYRADPDLQRLHQRHPMVAMWDDHESANDSWKDGAENHQSETEGEWAARKAASIQAWREWMPVSDEPYASYPIGRLATLFRLDTRLTGRDKQLDLGAVLGRTKEVGAALTAFRDGALRDPARTLLGQGQERWLAEGLRASVREGARWQIVAQQVVVGPLFSPPEAGEWLGAAPDPDIRRRAAVAVAASRAGIPLNLDAWDGYPAARERLLRASLDAGANLVTLAGDSHNAWAFDLSLGGAAAGVDMAVQSVTSPGFEAYLPVPPAVVAAALVRHNQSLEWADTGRRGYMTLQLTPERATGEWLLLDTVRRRSTALAARKRMTVPHGANRFAG